MQRILLFTFSLVLITACGKSDEKKIIGVWQNENDWFQLYSETKYNTGTGPSTFFKDLNYTLDSKTKEITFYTNIASKSYITNYTFKGNDTLVLVNKMEGSKETVFYKVDKIPTKFQ
jgi:hypothetical protein